MEGCRAHPTQNDVDALVEFWHSDPDYLLDDAARALLDGLEVTSDAERLRGAVDRMREAVEAWDGWELDASEDTSDRLKQAVAELRIYAGGRSEISSTSPRSELSLEAQDES